MGYIWQNYRNDKEFKIEDRVSPYFEVFDTDAEIISVNPMLRFAEIFYGIYNESDQRWHSLYDFEDDIDKKAIDNVVFHILAQIDRQFGLNLLQIVMNLLREDIQSAKFGNFIRDNWDKFNSDEQNIILHNLASRLVLGQNFDYFEDTVHKIFKVTEFFCEKTTNIYYLYIGEKENENESIKLEIIKKLFWNFTDKLLVYWYYHYGVIGKDSTMGIGNIAIV